MPITTDHATAARNEFFDLRSLQFGDAYPPATAQVKPRLTLAEHPLNLADYRVEGAVEPPPAVHRSFLGARELSDVLLNDQVGDCGEAMAIHGIEQQHRAAGTPVPSFGPPQAGQFYSEVSGWVPDDPSTDVGTDNTVMCRKWTNPGIADARGKRHQIVASLFVDPQDVDLNARAIWEFVTLFRAIGLPITAQGQTSWDLLGDPNTDPDAAVGSWGYHDIPYFSYDMFVPAKGNTPAHLRRYRNDSWGIEMLVTNAFDLTYAVQGFVVVSEDMLNAKGISPAGFDLTRLMADARAL